MDVVSAAASASPPIPVPVASVQAALAAPDVDPTPAPAPSVAGGVAASAPPTPGAPVATLASASDGGSRSTPERTPFSKLVSQVITGRSDVHVSYRITHDPNVIVTVFTDDNGKVINTVPPEYVNQIAEFFAHSGGAFVEGSA